MFSRRLWRQSWFRSIVQIEEKGRGEGPEAPSSRSKIRQIRRRSRTIASASWSDVFSVAETKRGDRNKEEDEAGDMKEVTEEAADDDAG